MVNVARAETGPSTRAELHSLSWGAIILPRSEVGEDTNEPIDDFGFTDTQLIELEPLLNLRQALIRVVSAPPSRLRAPPGELTIYRRSALHTDRMAADQVVM